MMKSKTVLLLAAAIFATANVRADDALLTRLVDENTYDLKSGEETVGGSGLEFLLAATRDAQFFSFAEPHNVKQVPQIFTMLFEALQREHGFQYAALETGPLIMKKAGEEPVRGNRAEVDRLFGKYPKSFHFFTDQELQMMADIGQMSEAGISPLWGVDQVHGAPAVLDELASLAENDETRRQLEGLADEARNFNKNRGKRPEFLKQDNDALKRAARWLRPQPDSRGQFLIEQLHVSRQVYRNYFRAVDGEPTGYASNCEREENMKTLFTHYYRKAQASGDAVPKVMLKSGHWHLMKGMSPGKCYTLGTFVMDLARSNGLSSFHLMVTTINDGKKASSITKYPQYAPVTRAGSAESWTIVDLRPLRGYVYSGDVSGLHADLRHWIYSYDAILMIGGTSGGSYVTEAKRRLGRL